MPNDIITTPFFDLHIAIGRALDSGVRHSAFWLWIRDVEGGQATDETLEAIVDGVDEWLATLDPDEIDNSHPPVGKWTSGGVTVKIAAGARALDFRRHGSPYVVNPVPAMAWYHA